MKNQITIPICQSYYDEQLKAFVMSLVYGYGLPAVLDALHRGLEVHYSDYHVDDEIQEPILNSINVSRAITSQLLPKNANVDGINYDT